MALEVNLENFEKEVLESSLPVLVDFFADWCGPCKMMSPVVDKIGEAIAVYKEIYAKCYLDKTAAYAGIAELLSKLKACGVKLAVFSNKSNDYVKNLADKLYPGIFDIALGAGVFASKPAPDGALDIIKRFGVSADETVFVGDSDVDVKTGLNAGMRVIGVSWGYRGHKFLENLGRCTVVDTVEELERELM